MGTDSAFFCEDLYLLFGLCVLRLFSLGGGTRCLKSFSGVLGVVYKAVPINAVPINAIVAGQVPFIYGPFMGTGAIYGDGTSADAESCPHKSWVFGKVPRR